MKRAFLLASACLLLTASACRKEKNKSVTVVRDCTGTYLRFDGKDYKVCNLEKVGSRYDGETITATFTPITDCDGSANNVITCAMLHTNEGWIHVDKVQ